MNASWDSKLLQDIRSVALGAGFDLAGVSAAPPAMAPEGSLTADRFASWIDQARAGEMDWLKRTSEDGQLLRSSARTAFPWARSVLVCALNYNADAPHSIDVADAGAGWIARYAWSADSTGKPLDYHVDLLRRLRVVEAALLKHEVCETRCFVDTGPILERDFAVRAGIGWIGKNTCVLNQQLGSWLLLGVIVTSLEVKPEAAALPAADRCGSCTRCIDACPTQALVAPREMDASLCISYLTIEHKGVIDEALRVPMGRQVFGCDICQDVCPWNRKAPVAAQPDVRPRPALINPPLEWLAALDAATFKEHFKGSPLERTKLRRLQRNVAIAMGNSGEANFLPVLKQWSTGADEVLRESAVWALGRLAEASASIGLAAEGSQAAPADGVQPDDHGMGDER